jgi:hypothetical protein
MVGDWVRKPGLKWHRVEGWNESQQRAWTACGKWISVTEKSEVMPLTRMIGQPQLCHSSCGKD